MIRTTSTGPLVPIDPGFCRVLWGELVRLCHDRKGVGAPIDATRVGEAHGGLAKRIAFFAGLLMSLLPMTHAWAMGSLVSPETPLVNQRVVVLLAQTEPVSQASIQCTGPSGVVPISAARSGGGPPFWWYASFQPTRAGAYRCQLAADAVPLGKVEFQVAEKPGKQPKKPGSAVWQAHRSWSADDEALYSAWIEVLFDAPEGTSWKSLDAVTSDPQRNLLHNHLALAEDTLAPTGLRMSPDCIENPYFLRAYYAWKMGLPFGFHRCKTRLGGKGPSCTEWLTQHKAPSGRTRLRAFQAMLGEVGGVIHSGAGRTPLKENATDLYPVPLTRTTLTPGTVFADPYGHTLTLVKWVNQTQTSPGMLFSVDAQPDGTIQIKRFWQGNFMFTTQVPGGPGFKHFRPILKSSKRKQQKGEGPWRYLTNRELAASDTFANYSDIQGELTSTDFFDQMEALINPIPRDPEAVLKTIHEALLEQLKVRVQSVENGEEWKRNNNYPSIPMPSGAAIFQTGGPWEDFSTPSRDLRLLLALDSLADFYDRLERTPGAFVLPKGSLGSLRDSLRKKASDWGVIIDI